MSPDDSPVDYEIQVNSNLRKLKLLTEVVQNVNDELLDPILADSKADLLIATENLLEAIYDLTIDVRAIVWEETKNKTAPQDQ